MNILYANIDTYLTFTQTKNIILIPIGCIENHGHLPLGTDTLIAKRFADDITSNINNIIRTPTINYGCNSLPDSGGGFHMVGTICMDETQFIKHLKKIVEEYYNKGHKRFVFLKCHYENSPAILSVMTNFYKKYSHKIVNTEENIQMIHLCYWNVSSQKILDKIFPSDFYPKAEHAGVAETSIMMHLYPEININFDNITVKPNNEHNYDIFDFQKMNNEQHRYNHSVLSTPKGSSREKGKILYEDCLHNMIKIINEKLN